MPRRVLTKDTIDQLLASGTSEIRLTAGDIVTALAKEYALERGLRLVPAHDASPATSARPEPTVTQPPDADGVGIAVREAVVAALGYEPDGLDSAISKALKK
ncbi:hypothetical protein GCM10025789_23650 [Tessaracoccus lubricantis]|uniref:Uncharacterized protein n=1 Tax=Tessaracoccus lubricantis TaxID=545543 RepID=A0ABP9FI55_9ACTN